MENELVYLDGLSSICENYLSVLNEIKQEYGPHIIPDGHVERIETLYARIEKEYDRAFLELVNNRQ